MSPVFRNCFMLVCFFKLRSIRILQKDWSFGVHEWVSAPRSFSPVLITVYSVLNLNVYLHFRVPEDWLGKLFDLFGRSILVTFGIHFVCILNEGNRWIIEWSPPAKLGFWGYKEGLCRRTICDVTGTFWSANRRRSSKVRLLLWLVAHLLGWKMFFMLLYAERCPQIIAGCAFAIKPFYFDVWHLYVHEC